jgi:hypothetical protein
MNLSIIKLNKTENNKEKINIFMRYCYYSKLQYIPDYIILKWFTRIKVFENFKNSINLNLINYMIKLGIVMFFNLLIDKCNKILYKYI